MYSTLQKPFNISVRQPTELTEPTFYVQALQTTKSFTITYSDGIMLVVSAGDYLVSFDDNEYLAVIPAREFDQVFIPSTKGRFKRVRAPWEPQQGEGYNAINSDEPRNDDDVEALPPDPHAHTSDELLRILDGEVQINMGAAIDALIERIMLNAPRLQDEPTSDSAPVERTTRRRSKTSVESKNSKRRNDTA